jgi:pyruvate/2-oxoglutarate dehydrogenase complex dihydrolipoamide acyltransferase (E2) component
MRFVMPTLLRFPKIGDFANATLSSWVPEDGALVHAGEPLYYVEHGDDIQEINAPVSGHLRATGSPGMTYNAGEVVGSIE